MSTLSESKSALSFRPPSEDAAQPSSHVTLDRGKDVGLTVLEVLIPAFQCSVQIDAVGFHTSSIVASGLAPYCVFEFVQAFLARPFLSPLKMVAQEVEPSSLAGVYYSCFGRMQFQSVLFYPLADLF